MTTHRKKVLVKKENTDRSDSESMNEEPKSVEASPLVWLQVQMLKTRQIRTCKKYEGS